MRAVRNLLFGVVAVQMNFIDRQSLFDALRAWSRDKDRSLADLLVERGSLDAGEREILEALVEKQLARNANDARQTLATFSSIRELSGGLTAIDDELSAELPNVLVACMSATSLPDVPGDVDFSLVNTPPERTEGTTEAYQPAKTTRPHLPSPPRGRGVRGEGEAAIGIVGERKAANDAASPSESSHASRTSAPVSKSSAPTPPADWVRSRSRSTPSFRARWPSRKSNRNSHTTYGARPVSS